MKLLEYYAALGGALRDALARGGLIINLGEGDRGPVFFVHLPAFSGAAITSYNLKADSCKMNCFYRYDNDFYCAIKVIPERFPIGWAAQLQSANSEYAGAAK